MLERMVIIGDTYRSYLGLALGFVIELAFLWVAWDLGKSGHDWLAGTIATVDMGAIVTTFITGGKMRQSERESKARAVGLRR